MEQERIRWICKQARGKKILDIDCSQGIVCLLLGREGFDCIGIDYEKDAMDYALKELKMEEEILRRRSRFQLTEASNLPFENVSFDTIILGNILEHLTHPKNVLKEAKRVLKEGAELFLPSPSG